MDKKHIARTLATLRLCYIALGVGYFAVFYFIPVRVFCGPQLTGMLYISLAVLGLLLLGADLIFRRCWITLPHIWLLLLFFCVYAASIFFHSRYEFLANIKTMAWMGIQMFLLCAPDDEIPYKMHLKHMSWIADLFISIWLIGAMVSFGQYCVQYGAYVANITDVGLHYSRQGFVDNRLFGVFTDPNFASICSILAIGLAVLALYLHRGEKLRRIYYIVSIVFQLIYVILSGSRTSILACMAVAAVGGAMLAGVWIQKRGVIRALSLLLAAVLSAAIFYGGQQVVKIGLSYVPGAVAKVWQMADPDAAPDDDFSLEDLERYDVEGSENISNNRFAIWSDYLKVLGKSPLLGVTPRGGLLFAEDHFEDLFILRKQYLVHNGYLAVLVGTGILGAVPMALWLLLALWKVFAYLRTHRTERDGRYVVVSILTAASAAPLVAAFFLLELFFCMEISAFLFWPLFGYLLCFIRQTEPTHAGNKKRLFLPRLLSR